MKNPKGPPLPIQLPPTIIRPDNPPLPSPYPGTVTTRAYTASPLPWDGTIAGTAQVQDFFQRKDIKSERMIMAVIVTITTQQDHLEKSYNLYARSLASQLDHGTAITVGATPEEIILEKDRTERLIEQKRSDLLINLATANSFFGRDHFNKDIKKNAVDFLNKLHSSRRPATDVYNSWLKSITAAYTSKSLTEEINVLNDKSKALAAIYKAQNEKRTNLRARIASEIDRKTLTPPIITTRQPLAPAITNLDRFAVLPLEKRHDLENMFSIQPSLAKANLAERIEAAHNSGRPQAARAFDAERQQRIDVAMNRLPARLPEFHAGRFNRESNLNKTNHHYRIPGVLASSTPLIITSAGTVAVVDGAALALRTAIQLSITSATGLLAGVASGLFVGVAALVYSPKLANGELPERYTFSTPLSDLAPTQGGDLYAVAAASGTIDLPVRLSSKSGADGQSEILVVNTGTGISSKVRVVPATYNAEHNTYTATTEDSPPITLRGHRLFNLKAARLHFPPPHLPHLFIQARL